MPVLSLVVPLVGAGGCGACGKGGEEPPPAPAAPARPQDAETYGEGSGTQGGDSDSDEGADAEVVAPRVELVAPGKEPREPLRFAPRANGSQTMLLTNRVTIDVRMTPGSPTPMVVRGPELQTQLQVTPRVLDDGQLAFEWLTTRIALVGDTPAQTKALAPLETAWRALEGAKTRVVTDRRGQVEEATFEWPASIPAEMRHDVQGFEEAVRELAIVLPAEPVGVGARWRVAKTAPFGGVMVEKVSTYVLAGREGSVLTLRVTNDGSAAPQDVALPGLPPGARATLEWLDLRGEGTARLDLAGAAPDSSLELRSEMKGAYEADGQRVALVTKMHMEVRSRAVDLDQPGG